MKSEKILLGRERIECISNNLNRLLNNEDYKDFELELLTDDSGKQALVITPFVEPVKIILNNYP